MARIPGQELVRRLTRAVMEEVREEAEAGAGAVTMEQIVALTR